MSKKVVARKNCPYDPTLGGKLSRYEGYALIASGREDPGISQECQIEVPPGFAGPILCAPSRRCRETAELLRRQLGGQAAIAVPELAEIRFELPKLASRDEYDRHGSNLVRERFVSAFIHDQLDEPRGTIAIRIQHLLGELSRGSDDRYLLVSHSFLLKTLQASLEQPALFDTPTLLRRHFDPGKKTFEFGQGFEFALPQWIATDRS